MKFYPEVKSQTGLSSLRVSCKRARSHPRCFGPLGKFQHNIKISIKTARVSRLSVSYDYAEIYSTSEVPANPVTNPFTDLLTDRALTNCAPFIK